MPRIDGRPGPAARERVSLGSDAFRRIAAAISSGELAPGERLRDVDLAARLHMSRMPVREALQRLERVGLVEILPSRLTRVTEVTAETRRMSRLHAGYQAGVVAHMSLRRLTVQERATAARLVDAMAATFTDPMRGSQARRDFYSYLSERSGNALHHMHMSDMEATLERNLGGLEVPPAMHPRMRALCAELRAAVLAGDGSRAERLVREQHGIAESRPGPAVSGRPVPRTDAGRGRPPSPRRA